MDENAAGATVTAVSTENATSVTVDNDSFEVADGNLKLKDGASLDFEAVSGGTVEVTITASGDGASATHTVTVTVNDIDEAPSAPEVRDGPFSLAENDEGAVVTSLNDSTDPEGDDISYSVDHDSFEITDTLVLKLKDGASLNFEDGASVDLTLSASDPAGNTSTSVVTIEVTDVNEGPVLTVADGAVDENDDGAMVGAVSAEDPDAGDTLTYTTDNADFEVAGGMLKLVDGASLNYEDGDSVTVMVTVTDAAGLDDTKAVTVTVNDVNESPSVTITGGATVPVMDVESSLTVAENAMGADLPPLALIEVSDPDAADAAMLTGRDGMMATSVDDDRFEVKLDPEGGLWLALKSDASLDHEAATDGTVDVTVTFTDSAGNTGSAVATVVVTDLNEAPSVTVQDGTTPDGMEATSSIEENVAGALIGEIVVEDQDEGDTWTPSVGENSHFEVKQDAEGGWWLKLKDDVSLNYEDAASVDVDVTVTDGSGLTDTTTVTVTVANIEEAPSTPVLRTADPSVDENDAGASVSVLDSEDPQGDDITFNVSDSRFEVVDGLLKLKDGESLNHEAEDEVTFTVTATDGTYESAAATVTIAVNDMNENPTAVGSVPNVAAAAGRSVDESIDLTNLFSDPDDGDTLVRYEISGGPSWLSLVVEYTTDDDGNDVVMGHLRGTPPTTGSESAAAHTVTLTGTDAGGKSGQTTFHVVVDDANDPVTGVNLLDHNGNAVSEVEVDENDASGIVLGEIAVEDIDHPAHPNGMHLVRVDDDRFEITTDEAGRHWLTLKEGVALDHEGRENGVIEVEVTAIDMNGEQNSVLDRQFGAPRYKGFSDSATFTILVNDVNDAPEAQTIGNWWITVNEDLDADDVSAGDLLTVDLEEQRDNDSYPAFKDDDLDAGDSLTYSISGAPWVQIHERSGQITNVKDMLPARGVHTVTVTATDSHGESASASFNINVAHSDGALLRDENADPDTGPDASGSYRENSGEQRVATFTVSDPDQDIPDHEFAIKSVQIISVVNDGDANDARNATGLIDHDNDPNTPPQAGIASPNSAASTFAEIAANEGYAAAFRLSEPRKSGNTWTYDVYVRDTNPFPGAANDTTRLLNFESVEDIKITVQVTDGTGASDDVEIDIGIVDVNEKPTVVDATATNPTGIMSAAQRTVNQLETGKIVLYIKLEDFWDDPDEQDDTEDLIFGASTSTSWIDILHDPAEWGDIKDGPDGDANTADDVAWAPSGSREVAASGNTGTPADDDWVVIVEIDRTEETGSNAQGERGSFTLTAKDDRGGPTGSVTVNVAVTDQNLDIVSTSGNPAVTISGSAREGSTLRARFNENNDPDLAGPESPVLVLYTWHTGTVDTSGAFTSTGIIQRGTSDTLSLAQRHVGSHIQVQVTYYEVVGQGAGATFTSQFITAADTDGQLGIAGTQVEVQANTERAVSNSPDDGVGHFSITVGSDVLSAAVSIRDEDYSATGGAVGATIGANTNIVFSWQVSANGVGGWRDVTQTAADIADGRETLTLDDGEGRYYRAVATYDADGVDDDADLSDGDDDVMESVYSDPIRIADVADAADATATPPTTDQTPAALSITGSPNPGGTLNVSGRGVSSVQWQMDTPAPGTVWQNIPGGTGNDLNVTAALAGSTVRALVTYETIVPGESGVTAVVLAVDGNDLDGDTNTTENGILIGGSTARARPTAVDDVTVTGSVMGTGHTSRGPNGPITGVGNTSGHTVSITETVDLGSLFQDPDSSVLGFSAVGDAASNNTGADLTTGATSAGSYLFQGETGVLVLNMRSGELTYVSDQLRGHDGDQTDGAGNMLTLNITANDTPPYTDTARNSIGTADVSLRINVAPTGINFTAGTDNADLSDHAILEGYVDSAGTAVTDTTSAIAGITVNELVEATGQEVLATINVLDENFAGTSTRPGHAFGVHEVTVTGDDRFVITKTNGPSALRRDDGDGSTWELRLKRGATFDHETDDTDPLTDGTQIKLTFMATDGGGLSTPVATGATTAGGNGFIPITLIITVADNPVDSPAPPGPTNTPGLKDDEAGDTDDTTDDGTGTDNDRDGGDPTPPPPGMSLGLIEDFVENMDYGEQDLLEDYLLTIDDGLDIV